MKTERAKKKLNKKKIFKTIRSTLFIGFCALIILSLTHLIAAGIFSLLYNVGFLYERNARTVWFFDYIIVSIALGCLLSIVIIHRPISRMQRLIDAMEQISTGDFTARLYNKSKSDIVKRTVRMFNNMAQQLDDIETLSRDFANNFSHEFKTPIASINGFAHLLKNGNLTENERNEYLNIIIQESDRMSKLSANILMLSKIEQQSALTVKEQFNFSELIRLTISTLYQKWEEKNIDIIFDSGEYYITANKEMLGQVCMNLLDNAIKFSPENESITVTLKETASKIIFTVSNAGAPIPPEKAVRLFDKFYQGDESHSTSGNGLGLPLVKKIAELHDGNVEFFQKDELITFKTTLPKR